MVTSRNIKRLFALLFGFFITGAAPPVESAVVTEVSLFGTHDSNVRLEQASQLIDKGVGDFSLNPGLVITLDSPFSAKDTFSTIYRFDTTRFRNLPGQDYSVHSLDVNYRRDFGRKSAIVPDLKTEYRSERNRNWSYFQYRPSIFFSYITDFGLIGEVSYVHRGKKFFDSRVKNSYQNIGSNRNFIKAKFRIWHFQFFNSSLGYSFDREVFETNVSSTLGIYTGLLPARNRVDRAHALRLEEMVLLFDKIVINLKIEFRDNRSNSVRYRYRENRFGAGILFKPFYSHSLFMEWDYAIYDYYDNHFDTRYVNTREDTTVDLHAVYRFDWTNVLSLELNFLLTENDSTDSLDFNSLYSSSYSRYFRRIVSASIKYRYSLSN